MSDDREWYGQPEVRDVLRLRYRHADEALRNIAAAVREGRIDATLREMLAQMLDPDAPPLNGVKLEVRRIQGAGTPPEVRSERDNELTDFLVTQIDIFGAEHGVKAEAVFAEAKRRFGASRTKCTDLLREARKHRKENPQLFEMDREAAFFLKDAGDPDHQPL